MKKSSLFIGLFLSLTVIVNAQVARKTIVEHFTNTKCSICASKNPGLNANFNLHPQVLHISIHPSSPYSTCYLSMQNTVDNDARTNFYGVYGGTPRIVINGNVIPGNANYADTNLFNSYYGLSPFTIAIEQYSIGADSILSRIVIHRVANGTPSGNAKLFAGLVEDTILGNGGNGELKHYNVLRKSLFTSQGMLVALPANVGDSLVLAATEKYSAFWDQNRIATVAILQDATNKQVIQSELSTTAKTGLVSGLSDMPMNITSLNVFPNPAANTIILENLRGKSFTYQFLNINGALVKSNNTNSNRIDVSDLPNGNYTLNVFNSDFSISQKIVVLH
jgi:hypothetical protein